MKRIALFLAAAACALAAAGCAVTFPESGLALQNMPSGGDIIVHTSLNTYHFYSFSVSLKKGVLAGVAQRYMKTENPNAPLVLDNSSAPFAATLALGDIQRIDVPEPGIEPAVDFTLYGLLPAAAILGILVPIIVHGTP